jgi:resuscitation-promoting factor RpfB
MNSLTIRSSTPRAFVIAAFSLLVVFIAIIFAVQTNAASSQPMAGERLITIHDRGLERSILTHATTLRAAFDEASIELDPNDRVEPGIDAPLVASHYEANVYRARPVTIIDGAVRQKVMSSYQTPKQIAEQAHITLQDEDKVAIAASTDMVSQGAGVQLTVSRATPITLVLYGTKTAAYTQEKTVADMLKEKNIVLGGNDTLNIPVATALQPGMVIELWRNGKQTATEERDVAFEIEKIQDADQPVGYRKVTTPGEAGKRTVTYEVEMKNGVQVNRVEIQSVMIKEPKKQVEVVGAKPDFSGDFAAALAKLRSCEGSYTSWNPAGPYYGAYQFNQNTWSASAPAGAEFGNATPAQQDQAARNLYVRRGWQPWPNCGKNLPDIYR